MNMTDILLTIVCDAFDAGLVSDADHDAALTYLNGTAPKGE